MAIDAKCIQANVVATNIVTNLPSVTHNNYSVTLSRQSGNEEIGGVELVFTDAAGTSSSIQTAAGDIPSLGTSVRTVLVPIADLAAPSTVNVVVYFVDSAGEKQYCPTQNPFNF
jgi:hypothetical protein